MRKLGDVRRRPFCGECTFRLSRPILSVPNNLLRTSQQVMWKILTIGRSPSGEEDWSIGWENLGTSNAVTDSYDRSSIKKQINVGEAWIIKKNQQMGFENGELVPFRLTRSVSQRFSNEATRDPQDPGLPKRVQTIGNPSSRRFFFESVTSIVFSCSSARNEQIDWKRSGREQNPVWVCVYRMSHHFRCYWTNLRK